MSKVRKVLASISLAVGVFLINPSVALAGTTVAPLPSEIQIEPGEGSGFEGLLNITLVSILQGAIRLVLIAAAIIFFFVLVIGGIQWITSGGDKAGTETARKRITNALIGLAIVFAAWAIIALIQALFGVNILNLQIPTFTVK
ncbi:MAG TPA: hypothetical protein VMW04_03045 [Patescibacteria group bacterium]|nr:hypothetical protein [Patescibacteria group bacterium]